LETELKKLTAPVEVKKNVTSATNPANKEADSAKLIQEIQARAQTKSAVSSLMTDLGLSNKFDHPAKSTGS
jgi:hypothetical protein